MTRYRADRAESYRVTTSRTQHGQLSVGSAQPVFQHDRARRADYYWSCAESLPYWSCSVPIVLSPYRAGSQGPNRRRHVGWRIMGERAEGTWRATAASPKLEGSDEASRMASCASPTVTSCRTAHRILDPFPPPPSLTSCRVVCERQVCGRRDNRWRSSSR